MLRKRWMKKEVTWNKKPNKLKDKVKKVNKKVESY